MFNLIQTACTQQVRVPIDETFSEKDLRVCVATLQASHCRLSLHAKQSDAIVVNVHGLTQPHVDEGVKALHTERAYVVANCASTFMQQHGLHKLLNKYHSIPGAADDAILVNHLLRRAVEGKWWRHVGDAAHQMQMLLRAMGADVEYRYTGQSENTLLHMACAEDNVAAAHAIREYVGEETFRRLCTVTNGIGETPVDTAEQCRSAGCVLFVSAGNDGMDVRHAGHTGHYVPPHAVLVS